MFCTDELIKNTKMEVFHLLSTCSLQRNKLISAENFGSNNVIFWAKIQKIPWDKWTPRELL
jgi:hypothetical protein